MSNVAVFLDVQNLYHSSKIYGGSKISYKHLLDCISVGREVVHARAYTAHKDLKSSKSFYHALQASGIDVCSKSVWVKKTPSGAKVIPAHFDVEITCDASHVSEDVDTIVLCSGNGNFAYLAEELIKDGFNVEVWSFSKSTSDQLKSKEGVRFVEIPASCLLGNLSNASGEDDGN